MLNRWHRGILPLVGSLVFAACTGGSGDTTTTAATTTTAFTTTEATTTTTEPPTPNGAPIATLGDNNATSFALQFLMNCAGYGPLEVDGVFGPATEAAVQAMQVDLGREETGSPDDETLGLLSRACDETRRLTLDAGEIDAVGNVSAADPDTYVLRAEEDQRVAVVLTSDTGSARVEVSGADGGTLGPGTVSAWAADIPATQDYLIQVVTTGDSTTYFLTVADVVPGDGAITAADDGMVVIDDLEEAVSRVCLDTAADTSYVAESGSGHLVITFGSPGSFATNRGGVGAWVEFVYRDGSPGYIGFPIDLDATAGDRVVGTARIYGTEAGAFDEPIGLAFEFERSVAPCEGGSATPIVLGSAGLGVVAFGADADDTLELVRQALPGASPTDDTGWIAVGDYISDYGMCRTGTTSVRVAIIDNLTLYFTDAATSWASQGTRHFAGYQTTEGVFPLTTRGGVGPGSSMGDILAAHPDSGVGAGLDGGFDVFITSPVGTDGWLRALAPDAEAADDTAAPIVAIRGGRFCDFEAG